MIQAGFLAEQNSTLQKLNARQIQRSSKLIILESKQDGLRDDPFCH